jgi:hypothetical protein
MKKLILPFLMASLLPSFVNAAYQVQFGQQQINGENIRFVNQSKWLTTTPFISEWVNDGGVFGCSAWSPLPSTVSYGTSFQQSANDCQQKQTRTIQQREQNNTSHAYRDVGVATVETKTLTGQSGSKSSVGTLVKWIPASPTVSAWVNSGAPTGCTDWTPDASTVDVNVVFTQNATNCNQLQSRTVQNREQSDATQEYRNVGVPINETQTLINQPNSRSSTGTKTLDECSYVFGNSNTMSAWIYNNDNRNIEIWWKGVKIIAVKSSTVLSEYYVSGFKYVKSGGQIDSAKMDDNGHWYSYTKICRTPT